jgi:hypothetical protein
MKGARGTVTPLWMAPASRLPPLPGRLTLRPMNQRDRKRRERYLREIAAAEAKARSPEDMALRARQAQRAAKRKAAREEAEQLWARREKEAWDERCFLEEAMVAVVGANACPDCGERHVTNAEAESIDRIVDDASRTILAVHAVYRDGAKALIPFVGEAAQLSFAFAVAPRHDHA